jgi:hypothetical protein
VSLAGKLELVPGIVETRHGGEISVRRKSKGRRQLGVRRHILKNLAHLEVHAWCAIPRKPPQDAGAERVE